MNLFGLYYQKDSDYYEIILIGDLKHFINKDEFIIEQAFSMDKKVLDYRPNAFIIRVNKTCELRFDQKVCKEKNFEYCKLLKINKNINVKCSDKVIKVKVK